MAELALRRLTARDTEILRALASEATSEIADELGISPLTVQSHVKSIPTKLGVHSKIEARRGWSELDEEVRPALVRRIQQVASDLGRQAHGNGAGHPGSGDGAEALNRLFLLTPREIDVLQAMADGHSTARIADVLGISTGTVRST